MNDVPNEIILQIGDYLDMKECISLSHCCKKNQILNEKVKNNMNKWNKWYDNQCEKIKKIKKIDQESYFYKLIYFIFSRQIEIEMVVNKLQLIWLNNIAICLKIESYYDKPYNMQSNCIKLVKTSNWIFQCNKTMTYDSFFRKIRRQTSKEMRKERQIIIQKWTARCIFCTKKINAYNAFFNNDIGPLCIPCIQEDDDLEITEWKNYAKLH